MQINMINEPKVDQEKLMESNRYLKYLDLLSGKYSWRETLDQLFSLVRNDLIFDNLVIYQTDFNTSALEVLFAKSTGRGKNAGADASWGEVIANRVLHEKKALIDEPQLKDTADRLASPYLLGLPIEPANGLQGVLIFIRFGGPTFSASEIKFAELIADVTNSIVRRKISDQLISNYEEVKSVSKLQFDFINTISHELRSPLGFIKGYTTTLLRPDTNWDRETQKDFLEIIERETNNLTSLIEDLLDSSRLQSGQMKFEFHLVRLDSLLRDEVNRIHLTNPQLNTKLEFEPDIPAIEGDPRKLAQVFDNLLSNTIKYAPGANVKVTLRKQKDSLVITFADEGPGIPDMYLPMLFTRFFRVPESSMKAHGSGLGLFICKQIIENHEGSIEVSSSPSGTTFTITLPLQLSAQRQAME